MKTIQGDLYDYPQYYDLVFGSDWKAEFDFLCGSFEKFGEGKVGRVFEPACGTGRLLFRLAKAGYDTSGLDLNERAVAYCNARLQRHGLPPTAFVGDMTDFRLPRKVDAAFNMINSFRHLQTEAAARDHLQCIANCLRRGGLYLLGLHLTPLKGEPTEEESWSAQRGSLCVNTRLWTTSRDAKRREEQFSMTYDVYKPTTSFRIQDVIVFRTYTAPQIKQLIKAIDEFELIATYDFAYDLSETTPLDESTEDIILVLRKR